MICEKCKANIPNMVKFCPKCGAKVEIAKAQDVQTKKCPSCGAENPLSAKFCKVDGYNLQQAGEKLAEKPSEAEKPENLLLCPQCGTPHPLTAKFCRKDGTSLQKVSTTEQIKPSEVIEKEIRPEEIAEPKVEAPTEVKEEKIKPEIEKLNDVIFCPKCGAPNPLTAKFCRKDGTPLKEEIKTAVLQSKVRGVGLPKREVKGEVIKRTSRVWLWLTMCVLVLIIGGAGGYLYFAGKIIPKTSETTSKPAEFEKTITETIKPPEEKQALEKKPYVDILDLEGKVNSALNNRGLSDVNAKVDKDLVATLKGTVDNPRDKMLASNIAESFGDLKGVRNEIVVKAFKPSEAPPAEKPAEAPFISPPPPKKEPKPTPDPPPHPPSINIVKLEEEISMALKRNDLSDVTVEVDRDLVATLKGFVKNNQEMTRALNITKARRELRGVKSNIQVKEITPQPDIYQIGNDINTALQRRGLVNVYAEVDSDLVATLKGFVKDKGEESDAINIAKSYKELKDVRNNMQVKTPAKLPKVLEAEINNALRSAGFKGVNAYVNDNFEVTLKGMVLTKSNKDLAFRIARSFKEVKVVYDNMFVPPIPFPAK